WFDYDPDELGLDTKQAAKIKEVKQLRPLDSAQPWGIFWVNFEKKRLPLVVLRRILGNLVKKSRASANKADRPSWQLNDLLFISAYGEEEHRTVSFAHFTEVPDTDELPVLRVLGWDDRDSVMYLDRVASRLQSHLHWPDSTGEVAAWRKKWTDAFTDRYREAVTSADVLIPMLAGLAAGIRKRVADTLEAESERGPMRKLFEAVRELLIHDMSQDRFADMYAQTVAYGLLSASFSRPADITPQNLVQLTSVANPFLENLLESLFKLNRGKFHFDVDEVGINDVIDLLRNTNIEAIKAAFNDENPEEDPVIRFYEGFLKEYDPEQRIQRGVFFTPRPVVSYIVRSVHELLQTEFGLEDGLASTATWAEMRNKFPALELPKDVNGDDPFVLILDPATGTATFLYECIEVIERTVKDKLCRELKKKNWRDPEIVSRWSAYVHQHLLPRLYGYEIMMAPYAIAHVKLALKLGETGYQFRDGDRLRIYLTNSLEPPTDIANHKLADLFGKLAQESQEVNHIKRHKRFTVVIGNPPYASLSSNMAPWIRNQTNAYLFIDGSRIEEKSKRNHLQNDYIKFIRLADLICQSTTLGIFSYITSNSYLDGRTLRGLRWNLLQYYPHMAILNLYGDSNKGDAAPDDENVFDITEGVCILVASRVPGREHSQTAYSESQGSRQSKYKMLENPVSSNSYRTIPTLPPHYLFRDVDSPIQDEFLSIGLSLDRIYHISGAGMKSNRDAFATDEDKSTLLERMRHFADKNISDDEIRKQYDLKDNYTWKLPKARLDFRKRMVDEERVKPLAYRPFDNRFVYFDKAVVFNPRFQIMNHMLAGDNLAIVSIGQNESKIFTHAFVSRNLVEIKMATHYGASVVFPTHLHTPESGLFKAASKTNLTAQATPLLEVARRENGSGLPADLRIAHYVYAILYSPKYRQRYAEPLMSDFPQIPISPPPVLFHELARLGGELVALHLLESPKLDQPITEFIGGRNPEVQKVSWSKNTVWVDKAQSIGFKGVDENVWNFHIGGYQVCHKWLKDRKGRILSKADIEHYHRIVVALSETIRIMAEIDKIIDQHGGWPGAFVTEAPPDESPPPDQPSFL
ncbi:MAG: hypothetical protein K8T25_21710, partial [Planctomycetia bacterium]|nr:hypothetical protein [Planctomycetia bacterium]